MIEFEGAVPLPSDAASAQLMVSLIESSAGATSNALATSTLDLSDGAVLHDTDQIGEDWIVPLLSSASPDAIAAGTAGPGEVDLVDRQFYEEEEHEITITARRFTGTSYYWDGGGGDGTTSWGGDGGGGGGYVGTAVEQHTKDCGNEDGAAVQVADHVMGELPPGVSGPPDPVTTSSGNDWRKVEFGAVIVRNPDTSSGPSFGPMNNMIYSSDQPGYAVLPSSVGQPVQGLWHSHITREDLGQRAIDRYPSPGDWLALERIGKQAGAAADPSLWITGPDRVTREFKLSERSSVESLSGDQMKNGDGLLGRERTQSCG
jgi:hypothetical protein